MNALTAHAVPPRRGAWITLTLADGRAFTCRFVWASESRIDGVRRWCVDHGAYGFHRDDVYVAECSITAVTPAERPPLLLTFVDPHGKRVRVGRYVSREDAERALEPHRKFASDVRIAR